MAPVLNEKDWFRPTLLIILDWWLKCLFRLMVPFVAPCATGLECPDESPSEAWGDPAQC